MMLRNVWRSNSTTRERTFSGRSTKDCACGNLQPVFRNGIARPRSIGALEDKKFGYGDVDLIWGYKGIAAPEWEKGFGLAHIPVKHPYMRGRL